MSEYRFEIRKRYPLDGVATRWDHYTELRDLFADGIIACQQELQYSNESQLLKTKLAELKAAVRLIEKRLDLLSGFDLQEHYGSDLYDKIEKVHRGATDGKLEGYTPQKFPAEVDSANQKQKQAQGSSIISPKKDSQVPPDEPAGIS